MNKSVLASGLAEIELGRKTTLNAGKKKAESMRSHGASLETDVITLSGKVQPCGIQYTD